jgi:hypothetical protein
VDHGERGRLGRFGSVSRGDRVDHLLMPWCEIDREGNRGGFRERLAHACVVAYASWNGRLGSGVHVMCDAAGSYICRAIVDAYGCVCGLLDVSLGREMGLERRGCS